jgi:hypothetical protein
MTLQQFIEKWNGKFCEVAGSANAQNQCVDLANAYIRDILGLPIIEWTNAKDFPSKASPDNYEYILNTPTGVPKEGDLIIWGGTTAGHIAIFLEGDANKFRSFDQNYPSGSPCRIVEHGYSNVLGWLRPKGKQVTLDSVTFENLVRKSTLYDKIIAKLNVNDNETVVMAEMEKLVSYEDTLIQKDKQLQEAQDKIAELEQKLANITFKQTELVSTNETLQEQIKDYEEEITANGKEITELTNALAELKDQILTPVFKGWKATLVKFIKNIPF